MPIYEYACTHCGHQIEIMQKINEPKLTDCPSCQTPSLEKQISAAGFRLSGSGWYETDFKSGPKKNLTETEPNQKPAASTKTCEQSQKPVAANSSTSSPLTSSDTKV